MWLARGLAPDFLIVTRGIFLDSYSFILFFHFGVVFLPIIFPRNSAKEVWRAVLDAVLTCS